MGKFKFRSDFTYRPDALTAVKYRGGNTYPLDVDTEAAARSAGALQEKPVARPRRSARKGSPGTSAE